MSLTKSLELSPDGQELLTIGPFVNPVLNIIVFLCLHFVLKALKIELVFNWTIDIVAVAFLLATTFLRNSILTSFSGDIVSLTASSSSYPFLVYSLTSWIAASVLEFRTCLYINSAPVQPNGQHQNNNGNWSLLLKAFISVIALNSIFIMIHFCMKVFRVTFSTTDDLWMVIYHLTACIAKIASTAYQGYFVASEKYNGILDQKSLLCRMGFINIVTVMHSLFLVPYGDFSNFLAMSSISLMIDVLFRFILTVFYLYMAAPGQVQAICQVATTVAKEIIDQIADICRQLVVFILPDQPEDPAGDNVADFQAEFEELLIKPIQCSDNNFDNKPELVVNCLSYLAPEQLKPGALVVSHFSILNKHVHKHSRFRNR